MFPLIMMTVSLNLLVGFQECWNTVHELIFIRIQIDIDKLLAAENTSVISISGDASCV